MRIEALETDKRPVSAVADFTEVRDIVTVEVNENRDVSMTLLFDHDLQPRRAGSEGAVRLLTGRPWPLLGRRVVLIRLAGPGTNSALRCAAGREMLRDPSRNDDPSEFEFVHRLSARGYGVAGIKKKCLILRCLAQRGLEGGTAPIQPIV